MSDNSLNEKIVKQVEYYFGDINLSKDKFMQEEIQKDEGWISLDVLTRFNRLKVLSTDPKVIIDALKTSDANLLEIDEENKKIRRAKPLPENLGEFELTVKQNTAYVKGFPNTMLLDDLIAFFEKYGKILQVFMRRFPSTKQFKGSVFVSFESNEKFKEFMALDEVKYEDTVLTRESQEDYIKRKGPEIEKYKNAKQKKEQEKEEKRKQKQEAEEAFFKEQKVAGAVLHLKGLNEKGTRENLKETFDSFAKIKWVDYNKGDPEAYVRFAEANVAKEALDKALEAGKGELVIAGAKCEHRVLEGEEEETYWKELIQKLIESKGNKSNNKRRGGRNNNNKNDYKNKNKKRSLDNEDADENDDDADDDNNKKNAENNDDAENTKPAADKTENGDSLKAEKTENGESASKKLKVEVTA